MDILQVTPWTKHYYPSLCGHCHQPGSVSSPLKRCGGCQSFYYCSREHQQLARRDHKTLCQFIAQHREDGTPLFGGHTGRTRPDLLKEMSREVQVYKFMDQKVELIFLNPPVCRKTDCLAPLGEGGLVSCPDCQSVSWCSSLHRAEAEQHHSQFCQELKLARVIDSLENIHGLPIIVPDLSCHQDLEYQAGPQTIAEHLPGLDYVQDYGHQEEKDDNDDDYEDVDDSDDDNLIIQSILVSDILSGPLTLLEAARKTLPGLADKESLKIHIAGAHDYDTIALLKWEYLAHRLPALKSLEIQFIGPRLEGNNNNTKPVLAETCDGCTKLGRTVSHGFYKMPYHQFREREDFSAPDLVLVQNCGFHEFPLDSEDWTEGWAGLGSLLHRTGAPVIFTSYTKTEAQDDLRRFQEVCGQELEVLVHCEENTMRSHRPRRDMGLEEEIDVFYNNYYINIVKVK